MNRVSRSFPSIHMILSFVILLIPINSVGVAPNPPENEYDSVAVIKDVRVTEHNDQEYYVKILRIETTHRSNEDHSMQKGESYWIRMRGKIKENFSEGTYVFCRIVQYNEDRISFLEIHEISTMEMLKKVYYIHIILPAVLIYTIVVGILIIIRVKWGQKRKEKLIKN